MEEICLFVCEGEYCRESVTLPYNMKALVTLRSVAWKRVNEWNAPTSNPCKHPHWCDARLWLLAIIRLCAGKRSITLPKVKLKRERQFHRLFSYGDGWMHTCSFLHYHLTVFHSFLLRLLARSHWRSWRWQTLKGQQLSISRDKQSSAVTLFYLVRKLGNQAGSLLVSLCWHFCCCYWIVL